VPTERQGNVAPDFVGLSLPLYNDGIALLEIPGAKLASLAQGNYRGEGVAGGLTVALALKDILGHPVTHIDSTNDGNHCLLRSYSVKKNNHSEL
jgi:hypothetical protein